MPDGSADDIFIRSLQVATGSTPVGSTTPVANFRACGIEGGVPLDVKFVDLSTNNPTSWYWEFGDGYTSTEQSPMYSYKSPGVYDVSLTATNADGLDQETKVEFISAGFRPAAPVGLTATADDSSVSLDWIGNPGNYHVWGSITPGGPYTLIANVKKSEYIDKSLANDIKYFYVVTEVDKKSTIDSQPSNEVWATPPGVPEFSSAQVNDTSLVLTYNEALDTGSIPSTADFAVVANDVPQSVSTVVVATTTVTLTLTAGVAESDTVTVSYTPPATSPIQDLAGYPAAFLTNQPVTNITPPP